MHFWTDARGGTGSSGGERRLKSKKEACSYYEFAVTVKVRVLGESGKTGRTSPQCYPGDPRGRRGELPSVWPTGAGGTGRNGGGNIHARRRKKQVYAFITPPTPHSTPRAAPRPRALLLGV